MSVAERHVGYALGGWTLHVLEAVSGASEPRSMCGPSRRSVASYLIREDSTSRDQSPPG